MSEKLLRDIIILVVVFGAIWGGVAYFMSDVETPGVGISREQEQRLGDIMAKKMILSDWENITAQYPKADSAYRIIYTRLLKQIPLPAYDYHFYILRDSTVNAFTIAGGHIFIFEGLLKFCETPEELAAVLAHEIGHAEKRHITKKLAKELGIEVVGTILGGGDDNVVKEAGRLLLSKRFDRKYETEADHYAANLLEKAGISPYVMASFFRRLNEKGMGYNSNLEFLMTHPHNNNRIKDILNHQTPAGFEEKPFTINWKAVQQSLEGEEVL
jgi:beta-barrel assembly-enhancing protease